MRGEQVSLHDQPRTRGSLSAWLTSSPGLAVLATELEQAGRVISNVFGYHLVNVAIHIINGWLVYFLALEVLTAAVPSVGSWARRRKRLQ